MAKGNAKELFSLWETRKPDMLSGEVMLEKVEELVKAARVGQKKAIKFLAFKNLSRSGKKVLNVLCEPCDPYVKKDGSTPSTGGNNTW